MTDSPQNRKIALIVDQAMPPGLAANTAAVLALSIGRQLESVIGPTLKDGDGSVHAGITTMPVPILTATTDLLKQIRERAVADADQGLVVIDFTDCAQRTRTYDEYSDQLASATDETLTYLGLGLHGPRKLVQRLTGSLPLLR